MGAKTYNEYAEDDFNGPYILDEDTAANFEDDDYGVYLLAEPADDDDDIIIVVYVGRGYLAERLADHAKNSRGSYFYYKELSSEALAFKEECRLFHEYGKRPMLNNKVHPAVPAGSSLPKCSERGCKGEPD